jgi:hypothetical protein
VKINRQQLLKGQTFKVDLLTVSDDAGLYIWSEDFTWNRNSLIAGPGHDTVSFTAEITGNYQIEVYGYEQSNYILTYGVEAMGGNEALLSSRFAGEVKDQRVEPIVPVTNEPASIAAVSNPPVLTSYRLYNPMVRR